MKKFFCILITLASFQISVFSQYPGDLITGFADNGIYTENWTDTSSTSFGIMTDGNGHILTPGSYNISRSYNSLVLALDTNGSEATFGNFQHGFEYDFATNEYATAIKLLKNNKILVAGVYGYTTFYPYVIRLLSNGQPDPTFADNGIFKSTALHTVIRKIDVFYHEDSYTIIGAGFNDDSYVELLALDSTGTLEPSFGTDGVRTFSGVKINNLDICVDNTDSSLFIGCTDKNTGYAYVNKLKLPEGISDNSFGISGVIADYSTNMTINSLVLNTDSSTLTAFGSYLSISDDLDLMGFRVKTSDGTADSTFGVNGWGVVQSPATNEIIVSAVLQSDNKYYVGGSIANIGGSWDYFIGRLNSNGFGDNSFGTNGFATIGSDVQDIITGITLSTDERRLYFSGNCEDSIQVGAIYTGYTNETEDPGDPVYTNSQKYIPEISIYPNPAGNELFINTGHNGTYQLTLFNSLGQVIISKTFSSDNYMLDVSELQKGVYMLQLISSNNQSVSKMWLKN